MMKPFKAINKLPKEFYLRDPVITAPELLGKILVRKTGGKTLAGRIVEVEAYRGEDDAAAHSYSGKTNRNEVMFREGGLLYVYFTYGMHFCSNIVTGREGEGWAVLIRAIEPLEGIDTMAVNRFAKKEITGKEKVNLTNGPAKICRAFDIARNENGTDLSGNRIFLADAPPVAKDNIVTATRIGIKKAVDFMWRFYIKDNPYVSKK